MKHELQQDNRASRMFHVKREDDIGLSEDQVVARLADAGVAVSVEQAQDLMAHTRLVLEANRTTNLTRITAPEDVLERHIVDSLAFLPLVEPLEGRVVDIGSGAGYPGIPLAVIGADVSLCESVRKKADFLAYAVASLGLTCKVFPHRAEELATIHPGAFNVVVARAVTALPALVELAAPLLAKQGRLLAMKGSPSEAEEADGLYAAALCGLELQARSEYQLPAGDRRTLFTYVRVGQARIRLPRRPGMAQRQPLQSPGT